MEPSKVTVGQKEKAETAFNGVFDNLDPNTGWLGQVSRLHLINKMKMITLMA